MYCPKCGAEAQENQRFCKACGTNLQLIIDALDSKESLHGQLGIDLDALSRNATEFARSWKAGWSNAKMANIPRHSASHLKEEWQKKREERRERKTQPYAPRPKEYLHYSWQHNLRSGLISLFSGLGLGAVFYYLGHELINQGTLQDIEEISRHQIRGLEQFIGLVWLFALIPVLKGLAQIIYAAFFGESIATLSERFAPPAIQAQAPSSDYRLLDEPPASVTEHTTQIFEGSRPKTAATNDM